jgi:hypothetical protein
MKAASRLPPPEQVQDAVRSNGSKLPFSDQLFPLQPRLQQIPSMISAAILMERRTNLDRVAETTPP